MISEAASTGPAEPATSPGPEQEPTRQPATRHRPPLPADRIVFANQLRGLCVLAVMLVHYAVIAQLMRGAVAWVVAAPPLDTPLSPIGSWVYPPWLDLGKFGVGAFFLISGFVIPFSLRRSGTGSFLLARALRIYPTFWIALLLEGGVIAASGRFWHRPPAFGIDAYLVNGLLFPTLLGRLTVDWVSWTLSVEAGFYLLAALLRPVLLSCRVWPLMAFALAALAVNALQGRSATLQLPAPLASALMYAGFILIGTLFHYRHQHAISRRRLAASVLGLAAIFFASYALGPTGGSVRSLHTASFGLAILAFAACYRMRRRFRPNRVLDGLAAISYPLYLIHSAFGFTVLSFLVMACRLPFPVAALLAAALAGAAATALHVAIERPSIRLGHRLRGRRPRKRDLPPEVLAFRG